jgi:hypothetical protein
VNKTNSEFAEFLNAHAEKKAGKEPIFTKRWPITRHAVEYYALAPDDVRYPPLPIPASLAEANARLERQLPPEYALFMQLLGPGTWALAAIRHPDYIYPWDDNSGVMCGFIPIADHVDDDTGKIAINPRDGKFCFCTNDGYAVAADSFEQWIRTITRLRISNPKKEPIDFYYSLEPFIENPPEPSSKPPSLGKKQWWHFWR